MSNSLQSQPDQQQHESTDQTPNLCPSDRNGRVVKVRDLITAAGLSIPEYQRPYKWTVENVATLLNDVKQACRENKSAYRLGTVVFHREGRSLHIVDGQQRIVTLLLIAKVMSAVSGSLDKAQVKEVMQGIQLTGGISANNVANNLRLIRQRLVENGDFPEDAQKYLLDKCELVVFCLNKISEAFQFFDSQNARGRPLEPHDLLKAYHLRAFQESDSETKKKAVENWEKVPTEDLARLFSDYLYPIRSWCRGLPVGQFSKDHIHLFKGIDPEKNDYPLGHPYQIIENHLNFLERCLHITGNTVEYPFQLDQPIINGRRFFEMVDHYYEKFEPLSQGGKWASIMDRGNGWAKEILDRLDDYEGRRRTGDRYVRQMFDCLLLYYLDKFGEQELDDAVRKIFLWAYSVRLRQQRVQFSTMERHAREEHNLFQRLRDAVTPDALLAYNRLKPIKAAEIQSTKTEDIKTLMRKLGHVVEK